MRTTETATGRVAVVTGGSRGIGAAIARKLAESGLNVAITGRDQSALEAVSQEIRGTGRVCEPVVCDVTNWTSVEQAAATVLERLGTPEVLVNNAGIGLFSGKLHEASTEDWDRVLNTNLRGVFYCIRAFVPAMIKAEKGHIINISSIASKNPLPGGAIYAASKWGLNGLSYSIAEELRASNIRVSVVCPGSVNSEFSLNPGRNTSKMLQPSDVAHVVDSLVSQAPQSFISEVVIRPTQKP